MKKLIALFFILLMFSSCETDPAKRNIKQFVTAATDRSLGLDASKIKNIEIEYYDSLLTPVMLTIPLNEMLRAKGDYYAGIITMDSLSAVVAKSWGPYGAIKQSWEVDPAPIKKMKEFQSWLRKVYKVKVTFEDGMTREPRVIMDTDGVTPVELEGKVSLQIEEYKREMDAMPY